MFPSYLDLTKMPVLQHFKGTKYVSTMPTPNPERTGTEKSYICSIIHIACLISFVMFPPR